MLRKIPFHHTSDLRYLSMLFTERPENQEIQFITPGPEQADSLRALLQQGPFVTTHTSNPFKAKVSATPLDVERHGFQGGSDEADDCHGREKRVTCQGGGPLRPLKGGLDVITIAQFIREEWGSSPMQKSELITTLGVLWKKFFPGKNYAQFYRALKLLTDLRSYSLQIDLIETAIEGLDQDLQKAVRLFWRLCDELKLDDENKIYNELAEKWRSQEIQSHGKRHFIFWGFEYFSNLQIGLLESLSLMHQVDILAPAIVFDGAGRFDWPYWIKGEVCSPLGEKKKKSRPLEIIRYPKNHLNGAILNFFEKRPLQNYDIIFGKKGVEFEDILELPVRGHFFKTPVELLKNSLSKAHFEIQKFINQNLSTVINHCHLQLKESIERQNFKKIKNDSSIKKFLEEWQEKSNENKVFCQFDWELMKQVLLLDHPRLFYTPLMKEGGKGKILGLKNLADDLTTSKLIIVQSKYRGLGSDHSEYGQEALGHLATIGPIKREEFEFLFVKQIFLELLEGEKTYLFWEEGLETEYPVWNELMDSISLGREVHEIPIEYKTKENVNFLFKKSTPHVVGNISPTKLQTYIDCPQKYYYQYVERINIYPHLKHEFLANEKGQIEHKIIGAYLKKFSTFDEKLFSQVCHDEMNLFCQEEGKGLSQVDDLLITEEVRRHAKNGVLLLFEFLKNLQEFHIYFEVPINDQESYSFKGSVDCVITSPGGDYLFDFKRSSLGIPSRKAAEEYKKIQIWYYAAHLSHSYSWKGLGYLNLKDPTRSLFWSEGLSLMSEKTDQVSDLNLLIKNYRKVEENNLQRLSNEKDFWPLPLSSNCCQFCPLNPVCSKTPDKVLLPLVEGP